MEKKDREIGVSVSSMYNLLFLCSFYQADGFKTCKKGKPKGPRKSRVLGRNSTCRSRVLSSGIFPCLHLSPVTVVELGSLGPMELGPVSAITWLAHAKGSKAVHVQMHGRAARQKQELSFNQIPIECFCRLRLEASSLLVAPLT